MLTKTRVVNVKDEPYDIYIGRSSIWGNPYKIGVHGNREEVIELYKRYILTNRYLLNRLWKLENKILGCYCRPKRCHGDILIELVEEKAMKRIFNL